jgi:hypothetical protein
LEIPLVWSYGKKFISSPKEPDQTSMTEAMEVYKPLFAHFKRQNYAFICLSPETRARAVQVRSKTMTLEDFFGWNLTAERFAASDSACVPLRLTMAFHSDVLMNLLPVRVFQGLLSASVIVITGEDILRSTVRISNFYLPEISSTAPKEAESLYYIHSSFPATSDSVFFGPDTYLFVSFPRVANLHLPKAPSSLVDVCCGSGAGVIHMARTYPQAHAVGLDINRRALDFGMVNAASAETSVDFRISDLYAAVPDHF